MSEFILHRIKEQVNILNLILILIVIAILFKKYNKHKQFKISICSAIVVFLIASTSYLPNYLAKKLESYYVPITQEQLKNCKGKYYIHVLGSGAAIDSRLPATSQIGPAAIRRLAEGIRIYRNVDSPVLITSGNSIYKVESQASITKRAAVILGIPENNIYTLDSASTTKEEAQDLAIKFGTKINLIIVTDATHAPRAVKLFKKAGFSTPLISPCGYLVHNSNYGNRLKFLPSLENLTLTDIILHEYLSNLKNAL